MTEEDRLIPIAEIATRRLLPYSVRGLRKLIAGGRIKATDIGLGTIPRWAIWESEIKRVMNELET